jgi:hypothetical protein
MESGSPDVEMYIEMLKSNQYEKNELPKFAYKDIGNLLKYRNDQSLITHFPRNPISSMYQSECELGIYILWTVESIRATSIDSKYVLWRFPSQNPVLKLRNAVSLEIVNDRQAHQIASDAYYSWWKKNKNMKTDPLKNTEYAWH